MADEKVMVNLDVVACAKKYRRLADEFEQKTDAFEGALDGVRMRSSTAVEKAGEAGLLWGKHLAYAAVAEQFEHLIEARKEGRI